MVTTMHGLAGPLAPEGNKGPSRPVARLDGRLDLVELGRRISPGSAWSAYPNDSRAGRGSIGCAFCWRWTADWEMTTASRGVYWNCRLSARATRVSTGAWLIRQTQRPLFSTITICRPSASCTP